MRLLSLLTLLALAACPAIAQETANAEADQQQAPQREAEIPPPPAMPESRRTELPEPTVTIRREDGKRIEEYRVGGVVRMVRVTPEHGASYYLMDLDGDGVLEKTDMEPGPNEMIPMWILFSW